MPNFWDQNASIWQPQGQPGAEAGPVLPQQGGSAFSYDAFRKRAEELSAGSSGTNAEFQKRIYPLLEQEFGGIKRFGSKGDKIQLPSGEVIDAVISAGLGGKGYNWGVEQPHGPRAMPAQRPPLAWGAPPQQQGQPAAAEMPQGGEGPAGLDTNDPEAMAAWRERYPAPGEAPPPSGPMRADGAVAGPMSDGGGQAAWSGPGPAPWAQTTTAPNGGEFAAPTPYSPQGVQGPSAWSGQPITTERVGYQNVGPAAQMSVGALQRGGDVNAAQVVAPERIQGPAAIQAERLAAAQPFQGTTAADLNTDPSYRNRLDTSLAALQQATARNGTLRSTNTYQALMGKAGEMASEEFAATDARRARDYATNEGNRQAITNANNANAFSAYGLSTDARLRADLANQSAALTAGTFNASALNDAARFNAGRSDTMNLAEWQAQNAANATNTGTANDFARFNAGNQLQTDTINAGAANQAGQFDSAQSLAAWQAQQGMQQQTWQFNAARTDTANQNNFGNSLAAWQANVGAKNAQGQLDLGYRQADQNFTLGKGQLDLGNTQARNAFTLGQGGLANDRARIGNDFTLGQGQLNLGNKNADINYDLGLRNVDLGYFNGGNSFTLGQGQQDLGWANYGLNQNQQDWNQGMDLTNLGFAAANNAAGNAGNYGAASGAFATGAGNAGAAGRVGSANAWNTGIGGAVNAGIGAYGAYQGGKQQAAWTGPGPAPWEQ